MAEITDIGGQHKCAHEQCRCEVSTVSYDPLLTGLDPGRVAGAVDTVSVIAYSQLTSDVSAAMSDVKAEIVGRGATLRALLSLFDRDCPSQAVLEAHLSCLTEMGVDDVTFYNYGLSSTSALGYLRGALESCVLR